MKKSSHSKKESTDSNATDIKACRTFVGLNIYQCSFNMPSIGLQYSFNGQ